jgi:hypothetical protein
VLLLRPSALFSAQAGAATKVEPQPYFAGVNRALEALAKLGAPVAAADEEQIAVLACQGNSVAVDAAEALLDRHTLVRVTIEADGFARVTAAGAPKVLVEQGWRVFLVRVSNPLGVIAPLNSANSEIPFKSATGDSRAAVLDTVNMVPAVSRFWFGFEMYDEPPLDSALSGLSVEYRVIQVFSRDRGRREGQINLYTSTDPVPEHAAPYYKKGAQLRFDCLPSREIALRVRDMDGRGCVASLTIKDKLGRIYPLQVMRLAPDMRFQSQIYRADAETVRLPDGEYLVESRRGPEYLLGTQAVVIGEAQAHIDIQLRRWIDPAQWGWYSGDTHIHAAGCAHYEHPTEGVSSETMIRHVRGEGLSIGEVLTWGPSWYYQKQFFSGHVESPEATLEHPELQAANNSSLRPRRTTEDSETLLRYDVEVSGFPSSHCGHLVLLRLKTQDYPGTQIIQDWPSWNLPILQWARAQGSVAGYAHCGLGMAVDSHDLPNYEIPPMDGIGTQEAIVDATHGLVDFLSCCDTQPLAELNAWYHLLNCGFRMAMIGETDYPCISRERPGKGRSYVRVDRRPVDDAGYELWIRALQQGCLYCGDGRSHFLDFRVNGRRSGEQDLTLTTSGSVTIEALVAARLEAEPPAGKSTGGPVTLDNWDLENARVGTREVLVELVVNGLGVEKVTLVADGTPRAIQFKTAVARSSWVALRILPSSHTHPVFVQVGGKPIRASRRSAQWCRACVDKLWEVKSPLMRESDRAAAAEAFEHARKRYDVIAEECEIA